MQKIKVLSENLANMIAAGEVVERPVSVVRELVENAIDAGSSKIEISVREGGKRAIRVADNGEGMSRDDALLCLERHATSKIGEPSDLFNITTMGFRGEALASIASISRMTISTKLREEIEGNSLLIEGGMLKDVRSAGIPSGTIIEVKDLFFNTPARKKFLKMTATEMGHISDYVTRTAIAFPSISFSLRTEKGPLFELPSGLGLKERVASLLGDSAASDLLEISEDSESLRLSGYISPPSLQRSNGSGLYLYVNGRFIRDKVMRHALMQGYGNFIMRGKTPFAILFLEIEPAQVDVNVHPAKSEVRFRESGLVHSFISASVEKTLRRREWLTPLEVERDKLIGKRLDSVREAAADFVIKNEKLPLKGGYWSGRETPLDSQKVEGIKRDTDIDIVRPASKDAGKEMEKVDTADKAGGAGRFSSLNVKGQIGEMYILCEGEEGMVIIDQHAAYERIAFETLKKAYEKKEYSLQQLLIPETVDLGPKEAAAMEENLHNISRMGFDIENFGGRSFVIKAVPALFGSRSVKDIVADMAAELTSLPKSSSFDTALDDIIKRIACHSVVRGKRRMDHDEMRDLLKRMDAAGIVPHCPHGRPAYIDISISEIERRFERS
ncbi:MAG: DNA mismatch repair endonuclease MutL [bacterium]|nr:DNA mismatch repair endonuclease MutL [bacterium]